MSTIQDAKSIVEVGGGWIGRGASTFLQVIRSPVAFVRALDLENPPLRDAALFAVFCSVLSLALHVPVFRALGVEVDTTAFLVADTAATMMFWFMQAMILHTGARLFGVRGRPFPVTLVCFLYLTAFMPVYMVLAAPMALAVRRLMIQEADIVGVLQSRAVLEIVTTPAAGISFIATTALAIYLVLVYIAVFGVAYRIGRARSAMIILVSVAFYTIWSGAVEAPLQQMMFRAFHRPGL